MPDLRPGYNPGYEWKQHITPLKFNMEPEHQPLEKEIPFGKPSFSGSMLNFRRAYLLLEGSCSPEIEDSPLFFTQLGRVFVILEYVELI